MQLNDTTTELERLQEKVTQDRCVIITCTYYVCVSARSTSLCLMVHFSTMYPCYYYFIFVVLVTSIVKVHPYNIVNTYSSYNNIICTNSTESV